jgi:hypothetical protein
MKDRYVNLLAAIVVILAIIYLLTLRDAGWETQQMAMYLTVGEHVGFNINTSALYFGTVPPGGNSMRELTLSSHEIDYTKIVHLSFIGGLAAWSQSGSNDFELPPGQNVTVKITVSAPADAAEGDYTGALVVSMRRAQ